MNERGQYGYSSGYIGADRTEASEASTTKKASDKNTKWVVLTLAGTLAVGVLANVLLTIRKVRKQPRSPYYPSELARRDAERAERMAEGLVKQKLGDRPLDQR